MNNKPDRTEEISHLRQRAEKIVRERENRMAEKFEPLSPEEMARAMHELQVHQIELEMQNEELRRSQAALDTQRQRYFDLYDLAPVGYVTVTSEGVITEANLTATGMLGEDRGGLIRQPFSRYIHRDDQDHFYLRCRELFTTGEPHSFDLRMYTNNGTLFWARLTTTAVLDESGATICRIALSDITERKKAEDEIIEFNANLERKVEERTAELRETELRFRALTVATADAVYSMSPDWREMRHLQGKDFILDIDEASCTWLERYIHPDDQADVLAAINEAIQTRSVFQLEHRVRRSDGTLGWTFSRAIPLLDERGEIFEWFGAASDITERKRTEAELRALHEQTEKDLNAMRSLHRIGAMFLHEDTKDSVFDNIIDAAMGIASADYGNIQLCVPQTDTLQIVAHRGFPQWWLDFWSDVPKGTGACGTAYRQGDMVIVEDVATSPIFAGKPELEVQLKAGIRAVISLPLVSRYGTFFGMLSIHFTEPHTPDEHTISLLDLLGRQATDMIAQMHSREALRVSEERFNLAVKAAQEGVWDWNLETDEVWYSPRYKEMLGYAEDEIEHHVSAWLRLLHPDDRLPSLDVVAAVKRGERDFELEFRLRHKDGHFLDILSRGVPVRRKSDGRVVRIVGTHFDLTERKRAHEALYESNELLHLFIDRAPVALAMFDRDMRYLAASQRWLNDYGIAGCDIVGRSHYEIFPEITQRWRLVHQRGLTGEIITAAEDSFERADGRTQWLRWEVVPWYRHDSSIGGIVIFTEDITERKAAEEELRELNRSLEQLVAERTAAVTEALERVRLSEERYRTVVEDQTEIISRFTPDSTLTFVNEVYCRLFGKTSDELVGTRWLTERLAEEQPFIEAELGLLSPDNPVITIENRTTAGDGRIYWMQFVNRGFFDPDGRLREIQSVGRDITERKKVEDEVRRSHEVWMRTFNTISDLILIINDNYQIIRMNQAALDAFGIAAEEELPSNLCYICMHSTDSPPELCPHSKALNDHQTHQTEILIERLGRYFEVTITPIADAEGNHVETLHVAHDITERRQYERELEIARQAADAANKAKSEFLANMSHEIRTPLNGVIGMTQLLEFTELSDTQQAYLSAIRTSSDSLLALINDVLDLSKIEAGRIELERHAFSLRATISDVVKTQISLIHQKGLNMETEIPAEVPDNLTGDQLRLKQIILNLLGNAIKFTEQGGIRITVTLEERIKNVAILRIGVTDTGIGISPQAMERIFDPFVQADSSTTRQYCGTGLGLSICNRLANLMSGKIEVESTPGVGSTFSLQLPFAVNEAVIEHHDRRSGDRRDSLWDERELTILLVDDQDINLFVATEILQKVGHVVVKAGNGREALQKWQQIRFDMILMDVQMPVMDGIEATVAIREREGETGEHIPIIAMTARALREERNYIQSQGFDGYITKPFEIGEMFAEMKRCLESTVS